MAFKSFETRVSLHVLMLLVTTLSFAFLMMSTTYYVATGLTGVLILAQFLYLLHLIRTTNRELSRFFGAVRNSDFSQSFHYGDMGPSFEELGESFSMVLDRFRDTRSEKEEQGHYLRILVEHIPVALISVFDDGKVQPLNNAARRLFGPQFPKTIDGFQEYGEELHEAVKGIAPGQNLLVRTDHLRDDHRLKIAATQIAVGGEQQRILSMQDIQSELDANEFEAWRELGRVLTHELMNSLTPVSSLAGTAHSLLEELMEKAGEDSSLGGDLKDARDAVDTVARRSEGLLHFVDNYRQVMRVPPPQIEQFKLAEVCERIERLMSGDFEDKGISFECLVEPMSLQMRADPDLLEQALINLVKNALDVLEGVSDPKIAISGRLNSRGHVEVSVSDNGGGVDQEIAEKIFVPFYTTKRQGAGIGLSLTRQIMLGHRGGIDLDTEKGKGTTFTLRFP